MGVEFPSKTQWPESMEKDIPTPPTTTHTLRRLETELICHIVTMFP